MANRRQPQDFDLFAFAFHGNVRTPFALSPADEVWWQEYGVAMDAFHDTVGAGRKPLPHD
jgi:hypothetical protein